MVLLFSVSMNRTFVTLTDLIYFGDRCMNNYN